MELVMQTTEHQRVAILRKQRIATLLGEINVHLVGNGPAMACWPSLLMTGQMWRGGKGALCKTPKTCLVRSAPAAAKGPSARPVHIGESGRVCCSDPRHIGNGS